MPCILFSSTAKYVGIDIIYLLSNSESARIRINKEKQQKGSSAQPSPDGSQHQDVISRSNNRANISARTTTIDQQQNRDLRKLLREKEAENLQLRKLLKNTTTTPLARDELPDESAQLQQQEEQVLCGPARQRASKRRKVVVRENLSDTEYKLLRKKTTISVLCEEAFPKKVNNLDGKDPTYIRVLGMIAVIRGTTAEQLLLDGFVLSDVLIANYITDASHDRSLILHDIKKCIKETNPYRLHGNNIDKLSQLRNLLTNYACLKNGEHRGAFQNACFIKIVKDLFVTKVNSGRIWFQEWHSSTEEDVPFKFLCFVASCFNYKNEPPVQSPSDPVTDLPTPPNFNEGCAAGLLYRELVTQASGKEQRRIAKLASDLLFDREGTQRKQTARITNLLAGFESESESEGDL
ncbi:hypothetical protein HK102_013353 [Quaeritorhiza haematococci]|nr:hypothetical protein HK102_013353 [Quaeritorhiza haematococci]